MDIPLYRQEMEAQAQGHLQRAEGRRGKAPQGGPVGAAREWKTRRAWLREAVPAFQGLGQIPAEALTLLCCPNHRSSFFLKALPGAWQAPGFLE